MLNPRARVTFKRRTHKRATRKSFFSDWWSALRGDFLKFPNICLLAGVTVLTLAACRALFARPVLVISAFAVPQQQQALVGLSGTSAANLLLDQIRTLSKEANEYGKGKKTAPFLNTEQQIDLPNLKLEVAGISVEGVQEMFGRLFEKRTVVTGEVYWVVDGALMRARIGDDYWTVGPFQPINIELNKHYRTLALDVLSATNPNIAGLVCQQEGDYETALQLYKKWLSFEKLDSASKAQAYFHLGVVYDYKNDLPNAIEGYRNAVSIQPNLFEALMNLGIDFYKSHDYDDAVRQFKRAVNLKPNSVTALVNLADAQDEIGDMDEAVENYRKAIKLEPDVGEIHYNLGIALQKLGRTEEAEQELARSGLGSQDERTMVKPPPSVKAPVK